MIIFLNLQHDVSGPECKSLREQGARKKRERCPFECLRLRLWRCSASGSHELFVRGNCMPNCMCLRARVCLRMWSLFTQPSGRSLKHLGITRSALPGVRASGCPGGWGVSPSTSPLSPRLASDAALIKQYFTLIARFFLCGLHSHWHDLMNSWPLALASCACLFACDLYFTEKKHPFSFIQMTVW